MGITPLATACGNLDLPAILAVVEAAARWKAMRGYHVSKLSEFGHPTPKAIAMQEQAEEELYLALAVLEKE